MKKSIVIYILFILSVSSVECQFILNPILKAVDNRKEIKTYDDLGYMNHQEHFDKKGNMILSKIYNEKGEVLSIQYNEYTDEDELTMIIKTSTISDLNLYYYDHSEEGVVKKYYSSKWNRGPYDPRTKEFLQEVTTVEDLLKHDQVRKLIKKRRKLTGEIYLDLQGRKIKEINREKKKKISYVMFYEYDGANNLIKSTFIDMRQKKEEKSRTLNEYDEYGNRIKTKMLKLINKDKVEDWIVMDSIQTKYNDQNQKIEQLSTLSFGIKRKHKKETKTVWKYDKNNRLINTITYNGKGAKKNEYKYEYENNLPRRRYFIDYEHITENFEYKTMIKTFEIELYEN